MFLLPGTTHVVSWTKHNVLDTSTYYVRAVIRKTRTDTVIATLDLDDLGSGRFTKAWAVPQDETGFGTEISITKTIYTDSGYSSVSGTYGRWEDVYTIFNPRQATLGGYSEAPTIGQIERLFDKKLDERFAQIPDPADLSGVVTELHAIKKTLSSLEIPDPADLSGVVDELGNVKKTLRERIVAIFDMGKKAEAAERAEKAVEDAIVRLESEIQRFDEVASESTSNLRAEILAGLEALRSSHKALLSSMEAQSKRLSKSVADELAKQSKTVIEQVNRNLTEALKKPVKLDIFATGAGEPSTSAEDRVEPAPSGRLRRVKNVLGYG